MFFLLTTSLSYLLFPLKISSVNVTKSQETADLVTFTEEIFSEKLHFLRSENSIRCTCSLPNMALRILQ